MKKVQVTKHQMVIPTYVPPAANEFPMFFENKPYQGASGRLYPIPYSDRISDEKTDVSYEVYTLENEYIKTQVLPQVGGKILRGYDKVGEHDFIYYNEVIKPALVGLAGAWISGGIEFNWPQHHRPTTYLPLEAAVSENEPNTVWTGEVEPFNRMKGMAGISIDEGRSYIKAKVKVYNRTNLPQIFMWWANLAVPVNNDYRTVFPPDCEWVNDHDRRAVLEWPIAKGVYKTARPYDFGEGTDLSKYDAVKVPSSYLISQGQSDMDFVAGYDEGIAKGIVTVANHHISPGKKMWHWGIGDFGDMWCSNLTDKNGPYIELMTGVYTDNQPDFTWIAPYESREFEQYWYPVRDIGIVKNATIDAAMNLEQREEGTYVGFYVTGRFEGATVRVTDGAKVLYTERVDLDPTKTYQKTLDIGDSDFYNVTASLIAADGKVLVSYKPYRRGQKKPITPRQPVKRPRDIATVEELYINGYHLEQYKQHNYKAEDYYKAGLERDPGDIRCNTSMGRMSLKNARFEDCVRYCDKAIERLTLRNEHPTDTEAFYLKGLALLYLGKDDEAYDILYKAAWNYNHRSAAMFELANVDCKRGDWDEALRKLEESYGLNVGHRKAINLKCAVLRHLGCDAARELAQKSNEEDPLDLFAIMELSRYCDCSEKIAEFTGKSENLIDVACDYIKAGMYEDALYALSFDINDYPLVSYYRAFCLNAMGQDTAAELKKAASLPTGYCFPARCEDIAVLELAKKLNAADSNACYYLGSLYYDRFGYEMAKENWLEGVKRDPEHAKMWRNLAQYYFDEGNAPEKAREAMEKAITLCKTEPRLLLEYQQLLKNMDYTPQERLAVYEKFPEYLAQRDDCYLDQMTLTAQLGEFEKAIEMGKVRHFHIYEGGEGKLTKLHAWLYVLMGNEKAAAGLTDEAVAAYRNGCIVPKSYGEAKTFFNQEAHLNYFEGLVWEKLGNAEKAKAAFETGSINKAAVSEISLFRALCLKKLGREEEAKLVLDEMLAQAENLIENHDLRTYYGVGSPSPLPFENNIHKQNLRNGYTLKAFALLGQGKETEADEAIRLAAEQEPNDFTVYVYGQIRKKL